MACETIKMEISANPDFVSIIRLTTSGIANKIGFSIDDIEDMKVAVSEACTNAIKHSDDKSVSITYTILENGLDIEIKDKRMIVEALPTVDGCMLLLTVEDKKRKKYRLQNGKKCSCYDVGNSKNFLDVIQLLYKQNVCCNKNSAYEKDGVYYLIFDYPAVPKRFKRILHEYGVRCGDNIFAANLRMQKKDTPQSAR